MMLRELGIVITLLSLHGPVSAQGMPSDTSLAGAIDFVIAHQYYVRVTGSSVVEGRITVRADQFVRLAGAKIPVSDVQRIDYRVVKSRGIGDGALIGALIGGAAFVVLSGSVGGDGDSSILSAGLGAGAGGMIGAMVGAAGSRGPAEWYKLWPR